MGAEDLAAGDEKMGFHALQEKQAAKKKADRVEALKRLGKVSFLLIADSETLIDIVTQAFRKTEPEIDEAKLLQQILDAAKNKVRTSFVFVDLIIIHWDRRIQHLLSHERRKDSVKRLTRM